MATTNHANECPLCGVYLPTLGHVLSERAALEAEVKVTSDALRAFPKGPMGLTPDAVKQSAEWQAARRAYANAFEALRGFNATHKPSR